jgi:phosphoglycerol transferase MdoB-like AlkP superfamily enzyme
LQVPIMKSAVEGLLRPVFTLGAVYLVLSTVLRVVLWWQFGRDAEVGAVTLPWILVSGSVNDAVQLLYLLLPYTLYLTLLPPRWHASVPGRVVLMIGFAVASFALLYLMAVEYYFFEEFDARFNLVAFDYLAYPTEVIGDIRDAYPVTTYVIVCGVTALAITYAVRSRIKVSAGSGLPFRSRGAVLAAHVAAVVLAAGLYSTRTLAFADNRVANEIAINGVSSFFEAARTSEIDYHTYYATIDSGDAFKTTVDALDQGQGTYTRLDEGRLTRRHPGRPDGLGRLNVVVVVEESLGAEFSGRYGASESATPEIDALAERSLLFTNAYASGTRTVRGLEALTASFPPIPSVSILRRPGNESIANWGSVMRGHGYSPSFLYGGYGYFDNMNYFYSNNGFRVIDRNEIPDPVFENIWGVSDEDLFRKTLEHLDAEHATGQPFFTMIMTTSNHKPFTFREGVPGVPASGGGRRAGVRYADFALARFLEDAAQHPWFEDTLFVIVADHGARVYGRAEIPLETYRIPLLMYAPAHIEPHAVDTLTGQIDVAPTVLGLLGLPYEAPFFGQDVLALPPDSSRIAFFSHNHDVAVLRDGRLAVLGLHGKHTTVGWDPDNRSYQKLAEDPALERLGISIFQTAYEQFRAHTYE